MKKSLFRFASEESFEHSTLIVIWNGDGGMLEARTVKFLKEKLAGREFCSLDPSAFFTLDGVKVKEDVASIPSSRFYRCSHNLIILVSDTPQQEWRSFILTVLDLAREYFNVHEIFTLGAIITLTAHTTPRDFYAVCSDLEVRESLKSYGLNRNTNYESPPGQRPTLSSYLLWEAGKKNLRAASLWIGIPFYLSGVGDPKASKRVVDFFNRHCKLHLNLDEMNDEIARQSIKLMNLQTESPEVDSLIKKLETNITLNSEETVSLVNDVESYLEAGE
jgi:predicted ATP-grasp superfamily ATP-dependent carboligase